MTTHQGRLALAASVLAASSCGTEDANPPAGGSGVDASADAAVDTDAVPSDGGGDSSVADAGPAGDYRCTIVFGFSQTVQWYEPGTFEAAAGDERWEMQARGGAQTELWADPAFWGWTLPLHSPCVDGASTPERAVLTISGGEEDDPDVWAEMIDGVLATLRATYPSVERILLQPVVGGPDHAACPVEDGGYGVVRASRNHPVIDAAIALMEGGDVGAGASPEVRTCGDYVDATGHLTNEAAAPIGGEIGAFYAALDGV